MLYLDYTAHMPVAAEVLSAFCQAEAASPGNPNGHHPAGQAAQALVAKAQADCAALLGVQPEELIFTSGASESNNTALQGLSYVSRHVGRHILTTALEHASVSGCLTALQERGWEVETLPVTRTGLVDVDALREALRPDTVLVTLPAVDSELGTIQPVAAAAELLKAYPDCRLHVDATQAMGKIPFDFSLADTVSLSGHKFGGIGGSGLLWRKASVALEPLIHGGVSTTLYRSGTPAVGLAVSLAEALRLAIPEMEARTAQVRRLNGLLCGELISRGVRIHSGEDCLPHILCVGVDGIRGSAFRDALAAQGVCVSVKSACSVEGTPSRAVYAVTGSRRQALESWRISLSHLTTADEISQFLQIFDRVRRELKP